MPRGCYWLFFFVLPGFSVDGVGCWPGVLDSPSFYWVLPGFTGFYWGLLGFTGSFGVLLGLIGLYWIFYWVECFDWISLSPQASPL